jgi:hypothetical protein
MYAVHGNDIVVLVGDAPYRHWWRDFTRPECTAGSGW